MGIDDAEHFYKPVNKDELELLDDYGKRKVVERGGYPTKGAAYKAGVAAYNDFLHGNIGMLSHCL